MTGTLIYYGESDGLARRGCQGHLTAYTPERKLAFVAGLYVSVLGGEGVAEPGTCHASPAAPVRGSSSLGGKWGNPGSDLHSMIRVRGTVPFEGHGKGGNLVDCGCRRSTSSSDPKFCRNPARCAKAAFR